MKSILKVTFVIIGTMIGAGFASGKEIEIFFFHYGKKGILGLAFSCILTAIIIQKIFSIIQKDKEISYESFLSKISNSNRIRQVLKAMVQIFLLISFYVMVAGVSSYFYQEFHFPKIISASIMSFFCYITFQNNIKGVISLNSILIPILIMFISYLGIKNLLSSQFNSFLILLERNIGITSFKENWIISCILYASYNSIVLIPMLIELSKLLKTKKAITITSVLSATILFLIGICIFYLLATANKAIAEFELPMIEVVKQFGRIYQWGYALVILTAIFTSAISIGYSFLSSITNHPKKFRFCNLLLCSFAILVSNFGFSNLVSFLYPIFGILGLIQIILLFIIPCKF